MVKPGVVRPLLALCMIGSPLLYAAEGGVGRPITGQQVFSNAGIVPPEPGWVMSLSSIWYDASAVGIPVQYTDIKASITGVRGRTLGDSDSGTQLADALITPIAAGYHFDELNHLSLSLPFYVRAGYRSSTPRTAPKATASA
uniref:hypothetical protein n=1 Tax=Pseudomonas sp. EA_5y_Pfl2_R50 TaxID=3088691 RepID=UPI0030D75BEE